MVSTATPPRPIRLWAKAVCLALAVWALALTPAFAADAAALQPAPTPRPMRADFEQETASREARQLAHWVLDSGDNQGLPFALVDKGAAKVFVFDPDGQLRGASSALVGLARGDDTVPGIGNRKMSAIRPQERTTPAGRFAASLERSVHGDEILWVDYDAAIALHRLVDVPHERRLQRLASSDPLRRRITYGCINVPVAFFDSVVSATFRGKKGLVYVLPETRSLAQVFGAYDVEEPAGRATAKRPAPTLAPMAELAPRLLESTAALRY